MVDATSDSIARIGKISAFWASISQAVIFINLLVYLGCGLINAATLVVLQFLFWTCVFGTMMFLQASWVFYMVYSADVDYEPTPDEKDPPTPLPHTTTKYYVPQKNGYKIEKVVDEFSGVGE